jgi:hypothetical protein
MFIPNENWESWEKYYDIEWKTKNSEQIFNHLIKLLLNFIMFFYDVCNNIYIHIYTHTQHIYVCIHISVGAKMSIAFFD